MSARHRLVPATANWFASEPNWRFSALFAGEILFVFVVLPLIAERSVPRVIAQSLVLLVTAGTIALISNRWSVRLAVLGSFLLGALARAFPGHVPQILTSVLTVGYALLITALVGRAVFSRGVVDIHRIAGAIAVYVNLAVLFATAASLVMTVSPDAYSGMSLDRVGRIEDLIHFSLSTLTTLGYGDILPLSPLARSLADLEALIGMLFPATLLARLMSLQISRT